MWITSPTASTSLACSNGGPTLPLTGTPTVRGVSPQVREGGLTSPSVWEYAAGVNRQLGRAAYRVDFSYRKFQDFYIQRTTAETGRVIDTREFAPPSVRGRSYDLSLIENDRDGLRFYFFSAQPPDDAPSGFFADRSR